MVLGWDDLFMSLTFRWSIATGFEILFGEPEYTDAIATCTSEDRNVIIGVHNGGAPGIEHPTPESWLWTDAVDDERLYTLSGDERFF